jgi:hypothetical protein
MKSKLALLCLLMSIFFNVDMLYSQRIWTKVQKSAYVVQKKNIYQKKNFPSKYEIVSLDLTSFSLKSKSKTFNQKQIIELPGPDGNFSKFFIKETSNFEANLQAKFPNIKSYSAQGIDDPTAVAKISIGADGFHAVIFSGKQETFYIDPFSKDNKDYIIYNRSSLSKEENDFKCEVEAAAKQEFTIQNLAKNANDGKLRTFRLALACSAEYAQFHLGANQQNVPNTASDQEKKAAVLSAMNTSLTRINGIYEKDLSVKLILVADNDKIIFLDAATDGITDGSPSAMINEVQTICDTTIGNANYDIGHIFSIGGDGLARLAGVCLTGLKARGVTGRSQPVGDPYDIDFVVHELGHQFGATHTFNNSCSGNRTSATAVEPGSGTTIMSYAGICAPNVQSGNVNGNSDDYFHAVSVAQMWNVIQSTSTCAIITNTNNAAPVANAGLDYNIPKSTPFKLNGTATDEDGLSSLTYNWEQLDAGIGAMPPLSVNSVGPMFRSLPSKITSERYIPTLATVLAGATSSTWEVLPSVARELNFSFFVRDNNAGGGSSARDDLKVTVTDAEAFTITSLNTPQTLNSGQTIAVNWNKGTTDIAPIECKNVNIKLSIDGGATFPFVLKANSPNDGSENIIVPDTATENARIMVEAADNIFYNVNAAQLVIVSVTPSFFIADVNDDQSACNTENQSVNYRLDFDFINGFTEMVSLSATGNPAGSVVSFSPSTINSDGTVTVTVSNLEGKTAQDYNIIVVANSASLNRQIELSLKLVDNLFEEVVLISPQNKVENFELAGTLSWVLDANAESYNVEVALDNDFTDFVFSENVSGTNLTITQSLDQETTYFWRVQPVNICSTGSFSSPFSFTTLSCDVCEGFGSSEFATSITNVKFNNIDNASQKDTKNEGYSNFTAIDTEVTINQTYELSVNVNTDGNFRVQTKAWIDWNKDCLFDETEEYDLGFAAGGDDIATSLSPLSIRVPENAKFGETTLRVSTKYTDPDEIVFPVSCEKFFDGEVEDYSLVIKKVFIEDAVFEDFNLFPNPSDGTFNLSFTTPYKDNVSVQLFDVSGRLIDSRIFNNSGSYFTRNMSLNVKSGGLYLLKIQNGNNFTTRKLVIK